MNPKQREIIDHIGPDPWEQFTCPDCGEAVPRIDLHAMPLAGFGTFYECPHCTVGSLVASWKPSTPPEHFPKEQSSTMTAPLAPDTK